MRGERRKTQKIFTILKPTAVNKIQVPELHLPLKLEGKHTVKFEVDTGPGENFLGKNALSALGKPELQEPYQHFESGSQHELPVLGTVSLQAETEDSQQSNVTELPELNLLRAWCH